MYIVDLTNYRKKRKTGKKKNNKRRKKKSDSINLNCYSLPPNKIIKVRLDKIIKHEHYDIIDKIRDYASRTNKIMIDCYDFIKSYCTYTFDKGGALPDFNDNTMLLFLKTVTKPTRKVTYKGNNKLLKDQLDSFYDKHYKKIFVKKNRLTMAQLRQVLNYCKIELSTSFSNHISEHYYTYLCRYINLKCNKNKEVAKINEFDLNCNDKKNAVKKLCKELYVLKSDIYNGYNKCDSKYDTVKQYIRKDILGNLNVKHILYGDKQSKVKSDPLKLYSSLIKMSKEGELLAKAELDDPTKNVNIINCFPLRKTMIPRYFKLDTNSLIEMFYNGSYEYSNNINKYKNMLWSKLFKVNKRIFKMKNYTFNGSIQTDGYIASITFELNKDKSKFTSVKNNNHFYKNECFDNKLHDKYGDIYLDKLPEDNLKELSNMNFVGIDPGKDDLIYCTNGKFKKDRPESIIRKRNNEKIKDTVIRQEMLYGEKLNNNPKKDNQRVSFRYSRKQRRSELKSKKYRDIIDNDKKDTIIDGLSVKEWEAKLSSLNGNTCIYENWKTYLQLKEKVRNILSDYYHKILYRQLRW